MVSNMWYAKLMLNKIDAVLFDLDQTLLDKTQSLVNFATYQYEKYSLDKFIPDRNEFIVKFSEINHMIMPSFKSL